LAYKRSKRDVEQNPLALKSVPLDELSRRERLDICMLALSGSRFDELSPHEQFKICRQVLSVCKVDASREYHEQFKPPEDRLSVWNYDASREVLIRCIFAKFDQLLTDDRWDLLADLRRPHLNYLHWEVDMMFRDLTVDSHDGFAWVVTSPSALPGQRCLLQKDGRHYYRLSDDQFWELVNLWSGSARPALVQADPDDGIVAPAWVKDRPLVAGWLKDALIQRPYSLEKVRNLLSININNCDGVYERDKEYARDMVKATTEYLVRFRPEYMFDLTAAEKTPRMCLAAIAGGKGRFLDAIPVERWHDPEFCEQAYRTGVPNVDAYIYYYGGENTWRNVLDACGKEYRLPAVVPNDAEQLPGGEKRKADAAPDEKAPPVPGIRRLGAVPEILGEIVAMTGDPLSDRLINEEVLLGSRGIRERARVRDREAAKLLRQFKSDPWLWWIPADKQTYRMVMTSLDFWGANALSYAAPKFQADPAFCLKAANDIRGAMKYVKAEKLSPENYLKVCLTAASDRKSLEGQGSVLEGVKVDRIGSKNYLKVCLAALNSVPVGFFAMDERLYVQWDKLDPADKLELNSALGKKGILALP
jgi:hypothetical protein